MSIQQMMAMLHNDENIKVLPKRFETIVGRYRDSSLPGELKKDVYALLAVSAELAEALLEPTYPTEVVVTHTTDLLGVIARAIRYLETGRPIQFGYAIMDTSSRQIVSQVWYAEAEAQHQLQHFNKNCKVTLVRLTSDSALQPVEVTPAPSEPLPLPSEPEKKEAKPTVTASTPLPLVKIPLPKAK